MSYHELKYREVRDSPVEYHYVDENHHRYDMSSHWHTEIEIIRILDGKLNINLNNTINYHAEKGDIILVNPEYVHRAAPESCTYECLIFNPLFFTVTNNCRLFMENVINHDFVINDFFSCSDSEFQDVANAAFEAVKNDENTDKFSTVGAMYSLLGFIVDRHLYTESNGNSPLSNDKGMPRLKKVLSFIRSNYDKAITLGDMAEECKMSVKHFCYFFKKMTQKTPVEYLNGYRIEQSARKLTNTDLSITDIAYSCGFNDLSYFIKTFKRIKGVTPGEFRKR